jgi:hypothetical protein
MMKRGILLLSVALLAHRGLATKGRAGKGAASEGAIHAEGKVVMHTFLASNIMAGRALGTVVFGALFGLLFVGTGIRRMLEAAL